MIVLSCFLACEDLQPLAARGVPGSARTSRDWNDSRFVVVPTAHRLTLDGPIEPACAYICIDDTVYPLFIRPE